MIDSTHFADGVSRWTALGIKLPKDLAKAVELFEAVRYVEVGHAPTFDIATVTPANAEDEIRKLADQLVLSTGQGENGSGLSPLGKAKQLVSEQAARQVLAQARAAVPEAIKQLSVPFEKAAVAYRDAVSVLPGEIDSDTLLTAGPDVVSAYRAAVDAAVYLSSVSSWVASTANLSGFLAREVEAILRVLRPQNALQLAKLEEAKRLKANRALSALEPVFVAAVRHDVDFGINTLAEAAELRRSLALRPQALAR